MARRRSICLARRNFAAAGPANWDWRRSPAAPASYPAAGDAAPSQTGFAEPAQAAFSHMPPEGRLYDFEPTPADAEAPLGAARAQIHETYIVAQTRDGLVIVDQHAAHERLVYERLKAARAGSAPERQALLVPAIVEMAPGEADLVAEAAPLLAELGLIVEPFGPGAVAIREVPAAVARRRRHRASSRDLAASLSEDERASASLERRLDHVLATMACHHSVRAGRRLGAGGDERAAARDGAHARLRPVQSRPPDLCRIEARRRRKAVRAPVISSDRAFSAPPAARRPRRDSRA